MLINPILRAERYYWNSYLWILWIHLSVHRSLKRWAGIPHTCQFQEVKIFPFCNLCLTQCSVRIRSGTSRAVGWKWKWSNKVIQAYFDISCSMINYKKFSLRKSRGDREIGLNNLENREEKEKLVSKILKIERRKRNFSQVLKIESRKRNCFSDSWKSRGERDMKISFSRAREKNLSHFSSRISRDRDSCQCLGGRQIHL